MKLKKYGIYKSIFNNKLYTSFYLFEKNIVQFSNMYNYIDIPSVDGKLISRDLTILNLAIINDIVNGNWGETLTRVDVVITFKKDGDIHAIKEIDEMNTLGNSIDYVLFSTQNIKLSDTGITVAHLKDIENIPYEYIKDIDLVVTNKNGSKIYPFTAEKINYALSPLDIGVYDNIFDHSEIRSDNIKVKWYTRENKIAIKSGKDITDIDIIIGCVKRYDIVNERFYKYNVSNILRRAKTQHDTFYENDTIRIYIKRTESMMFPASLIINKENIYLYLFRDRESRMSTLVLEILENLCLDYKKDTYHSILSSLYRAITRYIRDRYTFSYKEYYDSKRKKPCRLHEYLEEVFNDVCKNVGLSYRLDLSEYYNYTTEELIKIILFNNPYIMVEEQIELFMMRFVIDNPEYEVYIQHYIHKYMDMRIDTIDSVLVLNHLNVEK